jgi:hypothetical protein
MVEEEAEIDKWDPIEGGTWENPPNSEIMLQRKAHPLPEFLILLQREESLRISGMPKEKSLQMATIMTTWKSQPMNILVKGLLMQSISSPLSSQRRV